MLLCQGMQTAALGGESAKELKSGHMLSLCGGLPSDHPEGIESSVGEMGTVHHVEFKRILLETDGRLGSFVVPWCHRTLTTVGKGGVGLLPLCAQYLCCPLPHTLPYSSLL